MGDHVLYDCLDRKTASEVPSGFKAVLQNICIQPLGMLPVKVSVRAAWIENWWFVWVESIGTFRVVTLDGSATADHMLLTLSLSGALESLGGLSMIPPTGYMSLHCGGEAPALMSSGEFRNLVTLMPRDIFEKSPPVPGMTLAYAGEGAILANVLRVLASEASMTQDRSRLSALLPEIASMIQKIFRNTVTTPPERKATGFRPERVKEYLIAHLSDPSLSVDKISRACGLSKRQLYRDFSEIGLSISEIIRTMRLEKAALKLLDQSMSVSQVAYSCGFISPSSFSRAFHGHFGKTPSEFRTTFLAPSTQKYCATGFYKPR